MNGNDIKQILVAARAKLQAPEAWTKGADAKTADGRVTAPLEPGAERFCAYGAMIVVSGGGEYRAAQHFRVANGITGLVSDWNDQSDRTHEQVLAAFDKAIQTA